MQLFSIGLVELNLDGTVRLDSSNQPIPTYDQAIDRRLCPRVHGLDLAGFAEFRQRPCPRYEPVCPDGAWPGFHDTGQKVLLERRGVARRADR